MRSAAGIPLLCAQAVAPGKGLGDVKGGKSMEMATPNAEFWSTPNGIGLPAQKLSTG